jgi:hypothetical protein
MIFPSRSVVILFSSPAAAAARFHIVAEKAGLDKVFRRAALVFIIDSHGRLC